MQYNNLNKLAIPHSRPLAEIQCKLEDKSLLFLCNVSGLNASQTTSRH